jgi:hypothetical protein
MDAPTWWADVQQDRDNLAGRPPAEEWLEEDLDFVPRRRLRRPSSAVAPLDAAAADPLHGVFVATAAPRTIELVTEPAAFATTGALDDEAYLSAPPAPGQRRTIQIKGRPAEARVVSQAQRHRPRSAVDRIGHRPDRIALWVVLLGAILIILAAMSSSSQAAELHQHVALLAR